MKDIFSPIFLLSLALLFLFHQVQPLSAVVLFFSLPFLLITLWFFVKKKYQLSYWALVAAFALLMGGYFIKTKIQYQQTAALQVPEDEYVSIRGDLNQYPEIRRDSTILIVKSKQLEYGKKAIAMKALIRIKVMGHIGFLNRGDEIEVAAKIRKNRFNRNFFPNPMEDYVLMRGFHFSGYSKSAQLVWRLHRGSSFWRVVGAWRRSIRGFINKKYADGEGGLHPRGIFLEAILLGDRGRQREDQRQALLSAGVYHLLAISGAHIGIIAVFVLFLLKLCGVPMRSRYLIAGFILVIFLILSGFRISAQRAVFMALLIFAARGQYRDHNIFNIISFSGLLMLMVHPAQFLDAGYILTYGVTAGIVAGRRIFLPWLMRLPVIIRELFSANLSAALVSLPLSLHFFQRFSFTGLVSGLFLIPVTAAATALGILLIPVIPLIPGLAHPIHWLLDKVLSLFYWLVGFFHTQMDATIYRAAPSLFMVVVAMLLVFLLAMVFKQKWMKPLLALVLSIVVTVGMVAGKHYRPANLQVFFLAVGQGESEVVVFPGGEALLIDGGGTYYSDFPVGRRVVLPFLLQMGIRIKWVAVSHYHPDHARGVLDIIHILKPRQLWISSAACQNEYYRMLMSTLPRRTAIQRVQAGFSTTAAGCRIEVLWPRTFIEANYTHNSHSMVIKVSDSRHTFLFTGDIEEDEEAVLAHERCWDIRADVLKVAHHGSKTSSTEPFLDCALPRLAILSYGYNNRFKFPHREVLHRLAGCKARSLATAVRGGISVLSADSGLILQTSR